MGARTRQVRAAYREGAVFGSGNSDSAQLLPAFVFTSGLALAMLAGATSFTHQPAMQQYLRWAASVVMFLGCGGIGLRLLSEGVEQLRQHSRIRPEAPDHMRPNKNHAIGRVAMGSAMGVCVPVGIVLYQVL